MVNAGDWKTEIAAYMQLTRMQLCREFGPDTNWHTDELGRVLDVITVMRSKCLFPDAYRDFQAEI